MIHGSYNSVNHTWFSQCSSPSVDLITGQQPCSNLNLKLFKSLQASWKVWICAPKTFCLTNQLFGSRPPFLWLRRTIFLGPQTPTESLSKCRWDHCSCTEVASIRCGNLVHSVSNKYIFIVLHLPRLTHLWRPAPFSCALRQCLNASRVLAKLFWKARDLLRGVLAPTKAGSMNSLPTWQINLGPDILRSYCGCFLHCDSDKGSESSTSLSYQWRPPPLLYWGIIVTFNLNIKVEDPSYYWSSSSHFVTRKLFFQIGQSFVFICEIDHLHFYAISHPYLEWGLFSGVF